VLTLSPCLFTRQAAAAAKRALHDTLLFEKAVQIQFAKSKSDTVVRAVAACAGH
jgi:hypothetical protein